MAIKFEGLEELLKSLDNIANESTVKDALNDCCLLVERAARDKADAQSKGDGELARSITSKVEGLDGIVYTPLEYAPYVEYGTGIHAEGGKGRQDVPWVYVEGKGSGAKKSTQSYTLDEAKKAVAYLKKKGLDAHYTYGQHPQPYLRPALNENRELILKRLKEGLTNG